MNLQNTIDIHGGGPGSGCNPRVGKCGRKKKDVNIDKLIQKKFKSLQPEEVDGNIIVTPSGQIYGGAHYEHQDMAEMLTSRIDFDPFDVFTRHNIVRAIIQKDSSSSASIQFYKKPTSKQIDALLKILSHTKNKKLFLEAPNRVTRRELWDPFTLSDGIKLLETL